MPVTALEELKSWLSTYPGWEMGYHGPFPKVFEETSRREDVLGNNLVGCRYEVTLFWETMGQGDEAENARRLLDFQKWVQQQSMSGHAPHFGDVPARERIRAEKGGLTVGTQTVTYTITLIADFMKVYEVKE